MKYKAFLALLAMSVALMLPMMAAANETDPLVLSVTGDGYYENVTEYEWAAGASVTSGDSVITHVNLTAGGHITLDYAVAVTRSVKHVASRQGFRGVVTVENNTDETLTALELELKLYVLEGVDDWVATEYAMTKMVSVDETVTVPYDFDTLTFDARTFKVVASISYDQTDYEDEMENLTMPTDMDLVDINRVAIVDVDFTWLQSPDGITLSADSGPQSWILDTGNLTNGAEADLELRVELGTLNYNGTPGLNQYNLRMGVSITPANDAVFVADTLMLPVNITVPAIGSHSVHFYVTGGHGSIAAWIDTSELHPAGAIIPAGSQLSFVASPEAGYKVQEWKINNVVQNDTGLVMNIQYLAVNTVVTVEFAPLAALIDDDENDEDDNNGNPAAPALATKILKAHNSPNRIATTSLKKNGKATYINLISEVAKQNRGNSFMGVDRANQTAFYNAVYNYLKELGAQLP